LTAKQITTINDQGRCTFECCATCMKRSGGGQVVFTSSARNMRLDMRIPVLPDRFRETTSRKQFVNVRSDAELGLGLYEMLFFRRVGSDTRLQIYGEVTAQLVEKLVTGAASLI